MKNKKVRKNKVINIKHVLLFILIIVIACLMIHPIQLLKNNLFKPISVAVGANNSRPSRYSESDIIKNTYVDGSGKEYYIEFVQNLPEEVLLSYEDIIQHKAEIVNVKRDNYEDTEMKDLFIAEMKIITSRNYEERYKNSPKYDSKTGTIPDEVLEIAKEDSTITKTESPSLRELWQILNLGTYQTINTQEIIGRNTQSLLDIGKVYATTRTLNLYKRNPDLLTVENGGITAAEAYIMASTRNQSTSYDTDKNQQALWVVNDKGLEVDSIDEIPNIYKGLNPEANIVGSNIEGEANSLNEHIAKIEEFKKEHVVDGVDTEMYDNMLKTYDTKNKKNYYESGMAGLVGYDEAKEEYLVGPFSVDYIRTVYNPLEGGQNENQNEEGTIIFNSIIDAEVYGLNSAGEEVKLTDWEFIYTDVEYDLKTGEATRIAETNARNNYDTTPNVYPYPNENFYIRFKDPTILAITKLEFRMRSMNAEAEVYLYEGKTYEVNWVGATSGGENYLQMTPSWDEIRNGEATGIDVADLYQVKSARLVNEEKTITLSVGDYHQLNSENYYELADGVEYNGYCIPITMELGGMVWYDGTEVQQVEDPSKVFGERDKNDKDEYVPEEPGMVDIEVYLRDENDNIIKDQLTDENGNYLFTYVKLGPKYYIEFRYDGMKYKSTQHLNGDQNAETYKNSSEFLNYLEYSHARESESERETYNDSFTEIKNGKDRTSGQAVSGAGAIKDIPYEIEYFDGSNTEHPGIGGKAENDNSNNDYNISARTIDKTDSTKIQLYYPLQNSYMITGKYISEVDQNQNHLVELGIPNIFVLGGVNLATNQNYVVNTKQGEANAEIVDKENDYTEQTISYTMVDTYLHHINLGLIERAPVDFAISNDVVKVTLTQNESVKDETVKVPEMGKKSIEKSAEITNTNVKTFDIDSRTGGYYDKEYTYELDGDRYKYRYNFVENDEKLPLDETQIYVQYKMTIINQAEVTSGYITELANYYDKEYYYPVGDSENKNNESWQYYSWGYDGYEGYDDIVDSSKDYVNEFEENDGMGYGNMYINKEFPMTSWAIKNEGKNSETNIGQINWYIDSKFGSSNNKDYSSRGLNTMYTDDLSNVRLEPGETIDIYVTYKINTMENPSVGSGKFLIRDDNDNQGKRNIVEINAYESLIPLGLTGEENEKSGGRMDADSAAGNTEIDNRITYEDNADLAPEFKLTVNEASKGNVIEGHVWEDTAAEGVLARRAEGETGVNNVIVELVRLELNQKTGEYEEVYFTEEYAKMYPEYFRWNYPYEDDQALERILSPDAEGNPTNPYPLLYFTGQTSNSVKDPGYYKFENLVGGGKYKVRFIYGSETELKEEYKTRDKLLGDREKMHSGQDYRAAQFKGRIDLSQIVVPETKIAFVVDSYEMINKINFPYEDDNNPVIQMLNNINNDLMTAVNLKNYRDKIDVDTIITYGAEVYRYCSEFSEILDRNQGGTANSAGEAIFHAGEELRKSSAQNKIMIIYSDGTDSKLEDTKIQITQLLNDGITVIGIGRGTESLAIYNVSSNDNEVKIYTLNDTSPGNIQDTSYIEDKVYNDIINLIIDNYYFEDNISHAEDLLQDTTYYSMNGKKRIFQGRLQVMDYSQNMTADIADSLNIDYIYYELEEDNTPGSKWSKYIKTLANETQMTADSYVVSFDGLDNETKQINLGLQEIPERDVEITNQVDSIVVRLSSGRPLVNWRYGQGYASENVQEIKNELFSIYMDKEIMQGATIEVTYRIDVSNIGEVDRLMNYVYYATPEEQRNWYNTLTGEDVSLEEIEEKLLETVPIKITKIYSYFDNLVFRAQDNNKWEIVEKTVETNDAGEVQRDEYGHLKFIEVSEDNTDNNFGNDDIFSGTTLRDGSVVWTEVDTASSDFAILDRNKNRVGKYSVVETTSLKGIELYPNKSDEVRNSETSGKYSTVGTYLVLSKTLSAEDMQAEDALSYRNYVEIVETASDTGRRDYNGAEGNFTGDGNLDNLTSENDIDAAERVIILPPFGDTKIMIGIIVAALVILGVGVIFIKKKIV